MDQDASAFEPLSKAYKLPKNTPEEITYKAQIMEVALFDVAAAIAERQQVRKVRAS